MLEQVVIYHMENAKYPDKETDFRPEEKYPEYLFEEISTCENNVYKMVRESFHLLGYDIENYGTTDWNPLKEIIKPGDNVLLKPNMVMDKNPSGEGELCLYTQPSVVAAVIDYVLIALKGSGRIVVGDAPMQECRFDKLVQQSGYDRMIDYYKSKNVDIELVDFRELQSYIKAGIHYQVINENSKGTVVDLQNESEFSTYDKEQLEKLRITNYDPTILPTHHQPGKHEYFISNYVLEADVIISLPKPKTHRKAGITAALKNLVGINVRKEFLPHHCVGDVSSGGDEYRVKSYNKRVEAFLLDKINYASAHSQYAWARILRIIKKVNSQIIKLDKDKYREGSWYGNNTISKTIVDLNKILLYSDKNGQLKKEKQRKLFVVADIIVSGEKEGPVMPSAKDVGIIAMGADPVCFDETISAIMGMDVNKIPTIRQVRNMTGNLKITEPSSRAQIISNNEMWDGKDISEIRYEDSLKFEPTSGWKGHIESK
ncbi:MAG: DUF362 domain-containing protein [Lachnospiraceae bacterium]|nr:DUF362 domain-containing protein [Lachnospiraceae bacterium]